MTMPSSSVISKPSIRKHSSSEKLSIVDHHIHIHQENQHLSVHLALPSHKKAASTNPDVYSHSWPCFLLLFFFFFFLFFFILTIVGFQHSTDLSEFDNLDYKLTPAENSSTTNTSAGIDHVESALKGLGIVYRRGTKAMNELVIAHIPEHTQPNDFRLSLRSIHRSGLTSKADLVLLFNNSNPSTPSFHSIIHEENKHFQDLLFLLVSNPSPQPMTKLDPNSSMISPFNLDSFKIKGAGHTIRSSPPPQPLWGAPAQSRDNCSSSTTTTSDDDDIFSSFTWGSIVGFDVSELNPEDGLQGFIDQPPIMLRRWACYQMLLGMVRHRFKHVLLTHVGGVVVLGDPLALTRRKVGLYVPLEDRAWGMSLREEEGRLLGTANGTLSPRRGSYDEVHAMTAAPHVKRGARRRKARNLSKGSAVTSGGPYERVYGRIMWRSLEEVERTKKLVNGGVIVGGIQQIRGLVNAMVIEIVKVSLERNSREAFSDSVLLSYLLHKSSSVLGKRVLDYIHLMDNSESFVHSLVASRQPSSFFKKSRAPYSMVHGNSKSKRWGEVARALHKEICSSPGEAIIFTDCSKPQTLFPKIS